MFSIHLFLDDGCTRLEPFPVSLYRVDDYRPPYRVEGILAQGGLFPDRLLPSGVELGLGKPCVPRQTYP